MEKFTNKYKKIIVIVMVFIMCFSTIPNYSRADEEGLVGVLFKPIAQLIRAIGDAVIQFLQNTFVGEIPISEEATIVSKHPIGFYAIRYSPGIIFSGRLPAFDVNFISPLTSSEVEPIKVTSTEFEPDCEYTFDLKKCIAYNLYLYANGKNGKNYSIIDADVAGEGSKYLEIIQDTGIINTYNPIFSSKIDSFLLNYSTAIPAAVFGGPIVGIASGAAAINAATACSDTYNQMTPESIQIDALYNYIGEDFFQKLKDFGWEIGKPLFLELASQQDGFWAYEVFGAGEDGFYYHFTNKGDASYIFCYFDDNCSMWDWGEGNSWDEIKVYKYKRVTKVVQPKFSTDSVAQTLHNYIAKWYVQLRDFTLVCLLSILVYVGIKIIISSTGQDKSKYKKMLIDWVAAICILFVMHYVMNFTLQVVSGINEAIGGFISPSGVDELMSNIRNQAATVDGFFTVFANVVMYTTLVIFTVKFTIQYLKRLVYMAFLTLIAPLVCVTYPIDKMKDGQAQAFGMWFKEFMFNAFLQPLHLIIYYIFVQMASDFAISNPLYAITAIGFLIPAENFFKKMFGFNKAESVGALGAAAGGAAIMNMVNKLGGKGGQRGGSAAASNAGAPSKGIRTANNALGNSYNALRNGGTGTLRTGGNGGTGAIGTGGNAGTGAIGTGGNAISARGFGARMGNARTMASGARNNLNAGLINNTNTKDNALKRLWNTRGIKGARAVAGRYLFNKGTLKKAGRGVLRAAGAATLGTIGVAAGLSEGDASKIGSYGLGGVMAGNAFGNRVADMGQNTYNKGLEVANTAKTGYFGEEEMEKRAFKDSVDYKKMMKKYPGNEKNVNKFLDAGVTDTTKIEKALSNGINADQALAYIRMADECPKSILHNREKFKEYLTMNSIPHNDRVAQQLYENIKIFK